MRGWEGGEGGEGGREGGREGRGAMHFFRYRIRWSCVPLLWYTTCATLLLIRTCEHTFYDVDAPSCPLVSRSTHLIYNRIQIAQYKCDNQSFLNHLSVQRIFTQQIAPQHTTHHTQTHTCVILCRLLFLSKRRRGAIKCRIVHPASRGRQLGSDRPSSR